MITAGLGLLVAIPVGLYVAFGALMWMAQDVMTFPAPRIDRPVLEAEAAAAGAREVEVVAADGTRLYGWHLPAGGNRLVLYCGGNAEPVSARTEMYAWLNEQGFDVLSVSYRGYPGSEGAPSQAGLEQDVRAFWKHATEGLGLPPERIVLHGRSLGGGVVGTLLDEVEPAGVVLESTFAQALDLARSQAPIYPVSILYNHPFRTIERAPAFTPPVLVMHGSEDGIIPVEHGRRLSKAFPNAEYLEVPLYGHNDGLAYRSSEAQRVYGAFLARVVPDPAG